MITVQTESHHVVSLLASGEQDPASASTLPDTDTIAARTKPVNPTKMFLCFGISDSLRPVMVIRIGAQVPSAGMVTVSLNLMPVNIFALQ